MSNEIESKYSIHFLNEKPEYIDEMGKIFYNEWQDSYHAYDMDNLEAVIQDMEDNHARNVKKLPLLMIALDKQTQNLIATVGLEICDVSSGNPYYNTIPWLACTYTKPEHRGQSIAKYMIQKIIEVTKEMNYTHLWLWTRTAEDLFKKFGFHTVEKLRHGKSDITIMRIDFDTSNY